MIIVTRNIACKTQIHRRFTRCYGMFSIIRDCYRIFICLFHFLRFVFHSCGALPVNRCVRVLNGMNSDKSSTPSFVLISDCRMCLLK